MNTGSKITRNAVDYLLKDHTALKTLFGQYGKAAGGFEKKKEIADQIVRAATMHDTAETSALYPIVRVMMDSNLADHYLQDHQKLRDVMYEIENVKGDVNKLDRLVSEAQATFNSHIAEEEHDLFPKLQNNLSDTQMGAMYTALEAAKAIGPTHPHPWAPLKPLTGGAVAGPLAGMLDKLRDMFSSRKSA
eukprot:ANDGO_00902.mRNA.1 putative hemerythrin-like protein C869.06c